MRAVSLFSGAGGFEFGFDRAGIQTVLQAESDPWCLSVLARHWPDVGRVTDVRSVCVGEPAGRTPSAGVRPSTNGGGREAGAGLSDCVDLVYGGFPCQDVSVAGNRAGLAGERSGLWSEFRRVLCELRPRWFCAENVPGLLSSAGGRDFGTILGDVDELGYGVAWAILDARYFGVPQRRRRVFIVGCLGDPNRAAQVLAVCESGCGDSAAGSEAREGVAYSLAASVRGTGDGHGNAWNSNYVAATQSGGGHPGSNLPGRHHEDDENLVIARSLTSRNERIDAESENLLVAGAQSASDGHHGYTLPSDGDTSKLIAFDDRSQTVNLDVYHTLSGGAGMRSDARASDLHGVRRLTPLECERLMGWPDEHTRWTADGREIPDSHRYRLCGNGVVSTVAEWIGHRLVAVEAVA